RCAEGEAEPRAESRGGAGSGGGRDPRLAVRRRAVDQPHPRLQLRALRLLPEGGAGGGARRTVGRRDLPDAARAWLDPLAAVARPERLLARPRDRPAAG